jgi:hypothetical protein
MYPLTSSIYQTPPNLFGDADSPAASARSQIFSPKFSPKIFAAGNNAGANSPSWLTSCCGNGAQNTSSPKQQNPEEMMTPKQLKRLRRQRELAAMEKEEDEDAESEEEELVEVAPDEEERV